MNTATTRQTLQDGLRLHQAGKLVEAKACYEATLRGDPRDSDALHLLGLLVANEGQVERGIELIRQAIKRRPRFAAASFNLGNLLSKQERRSEAIGAYKEALAAQAKFTEAYINLSANLEAVGRFDEASATLRKALQEDRKSPELHRSLGLIAQKQGRLEDAVASLRRAIALQPRDVGVLCDLGLILNAQEKWVDALELFRRATSIDPQNARAWLNLASSLFSLSKLNEAEAAYRKVIDLRPEWDEAHCQLGHILKEQGRLNDAIHAYRGILARGNRYLSAIKNIASALLLQGRISDAVIVWQDAAKSTLLPRNPLPPEPTCTTAIEQHTAYIETPRLILKLNFTVVFLTGEKAITVAAPAFSLIIGGTTRAEALARLEQSLADKAQGETTPGKRRLVSVLNGPASTEKTSLSQCIDNDLEHLHVFAKQLIECNYPREALECMRLALRLGLASPHFLFNHGLQAGVHGCMDEALDLYTRAVIISYSAGEPPNVHGTRPLPDYLQQETPPALIAELLVEAAQLESSILPNTWSTYRSSPPDESRPPPGRPISQEIQALLQIEAHNNLAEDLLNYHCAFPPARDTYMRRARAQRTFLEARGLSSDILFLGGDWVRNIGHIACLGIVAKLQALGLAPWRKIVLLARESVIANGPYLKQWQHLFTIVTDSARVDRFEPLTTVCGFRFSTLFPFAGREPLYTAAVVSAIEDRWNAAGHPPLLALSQEQEDAGWKALRPFGLTPAKWFVCLHTRETGFHQEAIEDHRNSSIASYLRAVDSITARGGWVVRLGDPSMSRLPAMDCVIDYAHSNLKSPEMDVFCAAKCRFFIGTNSGLSHVPYSFGRPVVLTNWTVTGALPPFPRNGLFLPKMIFLLKENRLLSFRELLSAKWQEASYSTLKIKEKGGRAIDNSPEEIDEIVVEMLNQLEDKQAYTAEDEILQQRFASQHDEPRGGVSRIGSAFMRRHLDLLSPTASN